MTEPKAQQKIDGAFDQPTPRVKAAAKKYAQTLWQWQSLLSDLEVLKASLMEKMEEDDVSELEVSFTHGDSTIRYAVKRLAEMKTAIKCKKLSDETEG